ncbi:MAG: NAD-dependent dehydratase [Candidatus Eisenbacteria bacterium RBG_16_71_46]|nr:MAG: NAD-dependent dehydratase [Candidatus Eisenbacteria bacterium RBG_16_71_46]
MSSELKDRSVLVTGAGGFIGSHLVDGLAARGARVRALVHYNSRNDWGLLEQMPEPLRARAEVVSGDIRDPFFVDRVVAGVEIVFHLAALIPIPYSYVAPAEFVDTNVRGTLNVLEAVRRHATARMLHTSTSETYGTARYTPIDEKHPLQAQSPYAASKIAADKLAESYGLSFGTPVVVVRPFNTYGPRQSARAFLPTVLAQALTGETVRVGSLDPVRDMNYVGDTVAGFLAAAVAPGIEGLTINLGSGRGVSMRELLDLALEVTGRTVRIETDDARIRPEKSEVMELVCDARLARERLGWTPRVGLEDGVRRTAEWIGRHLERYKPGVYNI